MHPNRSSLSYLLPANPTGTILYGGVRYRAISKFALVVLRERNPSRQVGGGVGRLRLNGCCYGGLDACMHIAAAPMAWGACRGLRAQQIWPTIPHHVNPVPRTPPTSRTQSCDGWKEVAWNGEKLDVLRTRFQSHQRKAAARKAGAPPPPAPA